MEFPESPDQVASQMQSLTSRLNAAEVHPKVSEGKVVGLFRYGPDNETEIDVPMAEFGITDGYIDAHPEGSDRGGYVPFVFADKVSSHYDETGGDWQGY